MATAKWAASQLMWIAMKSFEAALAALVYRQVLKLPGLMDFGLLGVF